LSFDNLVMNTGRKAVAIAAQSVLRSDLEFVPRALQRVTPQRHIWSINVLLVDDDAADAHLILNVLRRHPSVAAALAADSPADVLAQLAAGRVRPDLILLDIQMPQMDGFRFLRSLRRIPAMMIVPVVFLTTSGLARDVAAARDSTAVSYVVKPDSYAELQSRLDAVVRSTVSGTWRK
jgi:CheY-like chemotaxis protein